MSILDLYNDFGIHYVTEGSKHSRPGWVNTACPFCTGNPGEHMGAFIASGRFSCWRCGWKPADKVISKLTGVSIPEASALIRKYKVTFSKALPESQNKKIQFKPHRLPSDCGPLQRQHIRYLEGRRFNPDKLEGDWGLLGAGPVASLDKISYKHRIIIPIMWGRKVVSFQGRDITGKSELKYLACPKAREIIEHQTIVYGDQEKWSDTGICVEGVTDVWRFGPRAFAVFGIDFTARQIRVIAKSFKRVFVVFDDEPQAIKQGKELTMELKFRGVDAYQEIIIGDPGEMDQEEADYFVKQLIGRG